MKSINVRNLNFRSEFKEDYAAYEAKGGAYLFLSTGLAKSFASSSHPIVVIQVILIWTDLPHVISNVN